MKTTFKVVKKIFLGLSLLVYFLVANNAYALGSTPVTVVNPADIAKALGVQQTYQTAIQCLGNRNTVGCTGNYTVPANQKLVIEFINEDCTNGGQTNTTGILRYTELQTSVGGNLVSYILSNNIPWPTNGSDITASLTTRIYADPGTTITVSASSSTYNDTPFCIFNISGQLVNVP